jgi:hypothetical protein
MYDLVHPDDVEKVREQLSTTESQNTGRILDLKSKSFTILHSSTYAKVILSESIHNFIQSKLTLNAKEILK